MELKWDDGPVSEPILFSKDIFDKYSLAPTVQELWALLQSPDVKEENTSRPVGTSSPPKVTKSNTVAPKTSSRNSHGSVGSASDRSDTVTDSKNNLTDADCKEPKGFPEPEVPYPCYTALSNRQRIEYLNSIKNKKHLTTPQNIMQTVQMEIAEFMKYVQDVSKVRADKYKYVPLGATRYLEEYFKASMEYIKYYPQHYSIQEITSLTGGKFIPDISLNFEKQLLAMGSVDMLEKWIVPGKPQLSVDYDSVSAVIPPSTKARHFHKAISSDTNAEKLSAIYEPHVCLAKEAFIQLLNNSSEHSEPWELPVWVKEKSGKGSTLSKTVYIDPPLLKTQMTWRERNHLFHEESIKLAYKKTASNPVIFLETEDFASKVDFVPEAKSNSRAVVSFDETGIDFEVDVTELESFGESSQPSKNVKEEDKPEDHFKHETLPLSKPKSGSDKTSEVLTKVASTPKAISPPLSTPSKEKLQEETVSTDVEDSSVERSGDILSEDQMSNSSTVEESPSADCPPSKRIKHSSASSPDHTMDSDEERLVIDHFGSPLKNQAEKTKTIQATPENTTETTLSSLNEQTSDSTVLPSTTSPAKGTKKGVKRSRVSEEGDQLGQILRMQNAMLKSKVGKGQQTPKPHPECRPPEPRVSIHHQPLVKPCVSSYLDSKEGLVEEAVAPAVAQSPPRKKRLLKEELRVSAEDEQDYEAPTEASVFYKLYSLMDVLLMVRSTVDIAHPRHDQDTFRAVPVHVLPKLEYQLCYGAELLTHTEVCRLWAEQLLHTSTASFIGRINAHTSKVAELQELPADWIQNTSCNFKPARCLNTLHHILKKVTSLPEGRYLLVHKPGEAFVSIFKANDGNKTSRSIYDLQAVHCGPPVPLEAKVPWIPLDPFHILPFHQKYKRPPCTFPPCPYQGKKLAGGNKGAKHVNTPNNPPRGTQQYAAVPGQNQKKKKNKKRNKPNKWTEKMKNKQKKEIQIKKEEQ